MGAVPVSERVMSVGVLNPIMRIFDVVMKTEYGTSYNSYLVRGEKKTALVETCHDTYFEQYLQNIRAVADPADIDYIILNHCEPDHSGALAALRAHCPKATVLASRAGGLYLQQITNDPDLPLQTVKDGETLDLGGCTLRFYMAPFLHWPDSMFTFCERERVIFTCDFLGAHYCEPYVFDTNILYPAQYETALREYYNAIFGPFAPYVQKGLQILDGLDFDVACTSHGPVLTRGGRLNGAIERYRGWSAPAHRERKLAPIFYCSAYSNTEQLAMALQAGIQETLGDADCQTYDVNEHDMGMLAGKLNAADAIAVGSPTLNADAVAPIWQLLAHADAIGSRGKPALVFGSYGWSGEAIPNLTARLQGLKMKVWGDVKVRFVPSAGDLESVRQAGRDFAKMLL